MSGQVPFRKNNYVTFIINRPSFAPGIKRERGRFFSNHFSELSICHHIVTHCCGSKSYKSSDE